MGFQQGLSGLNAASKNLEVIGNNVANANTVGFKQSQAQFADVFASSMNGLATSQVGLGSQLAAVAQQHTQGNISASNSPLDMAINGAGFFRMSNNGAVTYTRNGQFHLEKDGYIVNASGLRLTGYSADANGAISPGAPVDMNISAADKPPKTTTSVGVLVNLDSRKVAHVSTTVPFNPIDPTTYDHTTSAAVYDSLGDPHTLQMFYVKTASNSWDVYATNDGVGIGAVAAAPVTNPAGNVVAPAAPSLFSAIPAGTFSINGVSIGAIAAGTNPATQATNVAAAIKAAGITGITASVNAAGGITINNGNPKGATVISLNGTAVDAATAANNQATFLTQTGFDKTQVGTQASAAISVGTLNFKGDGSINKATTTLPFSVPMTVSGGAYTPFTVSVDYQGTTQFGSDFGANAMTQDGYASGRLSGISTGADGKITGRYTNGQSTILGQIVLSSFTNPNGLESLGANQWRETATSGLALMGTAGSGRVGVLQSLATEDSNVDLTAELVNMITAQRLYQANAQTIKTQDQVLQTLINLR